jgi:hypothetical protein
MARLMWDLERPHTYGCLPLGMADFTSGLRQFETYLAPVPQNVARRLSPHSFHECGLVFGLFAE